VDGYCSSASYDRQVGNSRIILSRMRRHLRRQSVPVALGGLFLGVDAFGLAGSSPILWVGGIGSIGYGIFQIANGFRKDFLSLSRIYETSDSGGHATFPYEPPYDSWTIVLGVHGSGITSPALNKRLISGQCIAVDLAPNIWKPTGEVEQIRELVALTLDIDEFKIRLSSDLLDTTTSVILAKTPYSSFVVTNHTALISRHRRGERRLVIDFSTFLMNGALPNLPRGVLSNHFGVDVIALEPNRIILVRQSKFNTLSPGLLAPSGSGSADWRDIGKRRDLIEVVKTAMIREMTEELGLRGRASVDLSDIHLLGYARLTHLGGKPQFYRVCRLSPIVERVIRREERYTDDFETIDLGPAPTVQSILASIADFEIKRKPEVSFPLHVVLSLLQDYLATVSTSGTWLGFPP